VPQKRRAGLAAAFFYSLQTTVYKIIKKAAWADAKAMP
jgi:hypothetical protein